MLNRRFLSVAALGLSLIAAGCASPRDSDNRMGGRPQAQSDADHHGGRGMGGPGAMADRVEGHLAFLKAELKITPAQEPRWNTFAAVMRDHSRTMGEMMQSMRGQRRGGRSTLPERLDRAEKMMSMHRDEMRKMAAAVRPLYAALSPAQRRTADDLLGHMSGGPMMMMGDHGMMGMMGGDRVEGRIAQLRTELKITAAQQPQWNAFANEMRAQSRAMGQMHGRMAGRMGAMSHDGRPPRRAAAAGSLPTVLDDHDKMMAAHVDALRRFRTAATALYATLNADQKEIADDLLSSRRGRHRGPIG